MKTLSVALRVFLALTIITGMAYPVLVTGVAQLLFPARANGSLVFRDSQPAGSALIGQPFDSATGYFTSRPSAVSYNPLPSGGSNYGLTNKKLKELVDQRERRFRSDNLLPLSAVIPTEMLFASASGLDPHISPEAAMLQVERISKARNFTAEKKERLVETIRRLTEPPQFLFMGQERINVLMLNLETDKIR